MKSYLVCLFLLVSFARSAEPLEERVKALLEKRCAECHAVDSKKAEDPELSQKTNLAELRSNQKYVIPGNLEKSVLIQKITLTPNSKKRMPQSKGEEGSPEYRAPLSFDEIAILKRWVEGGSAASNDAKRKFIDDVAIQNSVQANLQRASGEYRFLTLANWYNAVDERGNPLIDDVTLELYRSGLNKLINSLSQRKEITKLEPIDGAKVILRLNLSDYGWDAELWESIVKFYPFGLNPDTEASKEIAAKTGSSRSVVRGDWFVFATSQAPLYHKILEIPGDVQKNATFELERKLGIDLERDLKGKDAVRVGFEKSGVSQGNRVLERVTFRYGNQGEGYYWKSYDFDKLKKDQSGGDIFSSPLGPVSVGLTRNSALQFAHAGSEIVYSLPNGLQAYMLAASQGERLDEAPINIVTDSSRQDKRIINGISCMSCHKDGMFASTPKDEVLAHSLVSNRSEQDSQEIRRLYSQSRMELALEKDTKSFEAALAKCGVDVNKDEPVRLLYNRFMADIIPSALAGELGGAGSDSSEILGVLRKRSGGRVEAVANKFASGEPVPRAIFLSAYREVVSTLAFGVSIDFADLAVAELGGRIEDPFSRGNGSNGFVNPRREPRPPVKVIAIPLGGISNTGSLGMVVKSGQGQRDSDQPTTGRGIIHPNYLSGAASIEPAPPIQKGLQVKIRQERVYQTSPSKGKGDDGQEASQVTSAAEEFRQNGAQRRED